jgi:FMN phosphatase YigB (HAD superfamily)/glycosyltransferase involved in cell wall biosynthesis
VHVIVNDGGNPHELDLLVEEYASSYRGRVQVVHLEENVGMQNASNAGIEASTSTYLNIHDDDDSWHPEFLEKCVGFLEDKGPDSPYQGVVSNTFRINEVIRTSGEFHEINRDHYLPLESVSFFKAAYENPFAPIAFLYRRSVHDKIGFFNQQFTVLGDWDFNLRFMREYEIGVLEEKLAYYHWRQSGLANTVTGGLSEHKIKTQELKNHYLREDIKAGSNGLGQLLNSSTYDFENRWYYAEALRKIDALDTRVGHLDYYAYQANQKWWKNLWPERKGKEIAPFIRNEYKGPGPFDFARFDRLLKQCTVISFDVFDTCLLRIVEKPTDVFLVMQDEFRQLTGQSEYPYSRSRRKAEKMAREECGQDSGDDKEACDREIGITEIYEVLCRLSGDSTDLIPEFIRIEVETESRMLYANPLALEIYRRCREAGKTIVYVSDMYLPSETILDLLEQNGFGRERIFVSAETKVNKYSGRMYDHVLAAMECEPHRIMHIGDHPVSDLEVADEKNLATFHMNRLYLELPYVEQAKTKLSFYEDDLLSSLCYGLADRSRISRYRMDIANRYIKPKAARYTSSEDNFFYDLGYEVAGPLHFCFLNWIAKRTQELELNRLFFLSRDGYFLNQFYHQVREKWGLRAESNYIYASRRMLNFSRIRELDYSALSFLVTPNPSLTAGDFLTRIHIDPTKYMDRFRKQRLADLDEIITTPQGVFVDDAHLGSMWGLMQDMSEEILEKAAIERGPVLAYLESQGFREEGLGVVDIGWQASSLLSLYKLLEVDPTTDNPEIHGLYFATSQYAKPVIEAGCLLESYLYHLDEPDNRSKLINESVAVIEMLFSAPHPTVVGIDSTDDAFKPVYGAADHSEQEMEKLKIMWRGCREFVEESIESAQRPYDSEGFTYLEQTLDRILRDPLLEEARALGSFKHREGFGDKTSYKWMANPTPHLIDRFSSKRLKENYHLCPWKRGFLTQLTPRQSQIVFS